MAHAHARRGAGHPATNPPGTQAAAELRDEVRALARHLKHNAELALLAAEGEEPEHGAEYLLDTLRDLGPRFLALRSAVFRRHH